MDLRTAAWTTDASHNLLPFRGLEFKDNISPRGSIDHLNGVQTSSTKALHYYHTHASLLSPAAGDRIFDLVMATPAVLQPVMNHREEEKAVIDRN